MSIISGVARHFKMAGTLLVEKKLRGGGNKIRMRLTKRRNHGESYL